MQKTYDPNCGMTPLEWWAIDAVAAEKRLRASGNFPFRKQPPSKANLTNAYVSISQRVIEYILKHGPTRRTVFEEKFNYTNGGLAISIHRMKAKNMIFSRKEPKYTFDVVPDAKEIIVKLPRHAGETIYCPIAFKRAMKEYTRNATE